MNGMNDSIYAHDTSAAADLFAAGDGNLFQRVMQMRTAAQSGDAAAQDAPELSSNEEPMSIFTNVRPNLVQSIRAFHVQDLAEDRKSVV